MEVPCFWRFPGCCCLGMGQTMVDGFRPGVPREAAAGALLLACCCVKGHGLLLRAAKELGREQVWT